MDITPCTIPDILLVKTRWLTDVRGGFSETHKVVQAPTDKQQLAPMLGALKGLPDEIGQPDTLLADNGYFSDANVVACKAAGIEPMIATGREVHHPSLDQRFAAAPGASPSSTPCACG